MSEITQLYIISILQVLLAGGLINVWLVRFHKPTKYRGKGAGNMKDEFSAYGLPAWSMYVVGAAKLLIAKALILGFWFPFLVCPAVGLLVVLMLGAISMHIKVRDPFVRAVPALLMLAMALTIVLLVRVF
jgi:hypothetical protein